MSSHRKEIEALQSLLKANPKDPRLMLRLAEAFQKAGEVNTAASQFMLVADQYGRDGFFLKAIAVIKQALEMNPKLTAARNSLAQSYEHLDLKTEAAAEYQILLGHYRTLGAVEDLLRVDEALIRLGVSMGGSGRQ